MNENEDLIAFIQKESKNRLKEDYLEKHNPDLKNKILQFDFKSPYPLSLVARKRFLVKGYQEIPRCETCGDYLNKDNPDIKVTARFCSLSCSYAGERMSPEAKQHMIEIQRQNWFKDPERQSKFIAGVRRACQEGKYDKNHQMFAMLRREDPEFRRKQKEAAKLSQLENSRMSNPDTYQKMVNSKREQFSGYDLPAWYHKGHYNQACYNPKPVPFFKRLAEELNFEGPVWYGDHEKKFGRYFVDFFSETERLIIEWDEPHHRVQRQKEKDQIRQRKILDNNSDLRFIRAPQAEILIDDWGDQSYIKFKQLVMEALKSAE